MSGFSKARLGRITAVLERQVESGRVPGLVALVAHGEAVHVEAHGRLALGESPAMGRDTLFRIASLSKAITAAAAVSLVEEGRIGLDDPVAAWLPELAEPKVLRSLDAQVDDVVPAQRPITLRDLLTFRSGHGVIMAPPGTYPFQAARTAAGFDPGPDLPAVGPDEYMRRVAAMPLLHQPGAGWTYHVGSEILSVLLARLTGRSLAELLQGRILEPLGMRDTGFWVPPENAGRLAECYAAQPDGTLARYDPSAGGGFTAPPPFSSGGGGLVSTADDLLTFSRMLLGGGRCRDQRVLSRAAVELMTRDHITAEQRSAFPPGAAFLDGQGWGFGVSVTLQREAIGPSVGSFGWWGGYGTSWRVDPKEEVTVILLTQRMMASPLDGRLTEDLWTAAYQALDD